MKKAMAFLLLAALLCIPALAETAEDELARAAIPAGTPVEIDLDGDGVAETVSWSETPVDEYDSVMVLSVAPAEGDALEHWTEFIYSGAVYATDLDGDGAVEILLTGDVASDDYFTECLRYADGALTRVTFADGNRGENTGEWVDEGYGIVEALEDGRLTLSGSQDVLGTWFADRTYALVNGRFEFADGGEWVRDVEVSELDDDFWNEGYAVLTAKTDLAYTDANGAGAVLPAGAKLLVVASDKQTYARFVTRDGATGTLAVTPDEERGWGMKVNGVSEDECFEMIPYAD